MKRILYMNLLNFNIGQRRMDENIIRELSEFAEVYVVAPKNWYAHEIERVKYIYYEAVSDFDNITIQKYIKDIKNIFFANKLIKKYNFDGYLFASYNTAVFPLWLLINPNILKQSFIIHNNNIDRFNIVPLDHFNIVPLKKKLFKLYSKKVNHIVLEEFIGDFLADGMKIDRDKIFYLPHPLNQNNIQIKKCYDCVGISNSNDETWIERIIEIEEQQHIFRRNNCKIILRSQEYTYDNGFLSVIKGWLDDSIYNDYINKAKCIFLPYPSSFQYRMSGSVIDAFSNNTTVLGSRIPLFLYYAKKYGSICKIANSPEDFCQKVILFKEEDKTRIMFERFKHDRSNEKVRESLTKMFGY